MFSTRNEHRVSRRKHRRRGAARAARGQMPGLRHSLRHGLRTTRSPARMKQPPLRARAGLAGRPEDTRGWWGLQRAVLRTQRRVLRDRGASGQRVLRLCLLGPPSYRPSSGLPATAGSPAGPAPGHSQGPEALSAQRRLRGRRQRSLRRFPSAEVPPNTFYSDGHTKGHVPVSQHPMPSRANYRSVR